MGSTISKMASNTHLILLISISFFMVNAAVLQRQPGVSFDYPELERRRGGLGFGAGFMMPDRSMNDLDFNPPDMFHPFKREDRSFLWPFLTRPRIHNLMPFLRRQDYGTRIHKRSVGAS